MATASNSTEIQKVNFSGRLFSGLAELLYGPRREIKVDSIEKIREGERAVELILPSNTNLSGISPFPRPFIINQYAVFQIKATVGSEEYSRNYELSKFEGNHPNVLDLEELAGQAQGQVVAGRMRARLPGNLPDLLYNSLTEYSS